MTRAFQKILLQTKQIVHQSAWDRLSKKNFFQQKNPHQAQRDSNSAFRRLIAYFF